MGDCFKYLNTIAIRSGKTTAICKAAKKSAGVPRDKEMIACDGLKSYDAFLNWMNRQSARFGLPKVDSKEGRFLAWSSGAKWMQKNMLKHIKPEYTPSDIKPQTVSEGVVLTESELEEIRQALEFYNRKDWGDCPAYKALAILDRLKERERDEKKAINKSLWEIRENRWFHDLAFTRLFFRRR